MRGIAAVMVFIGHLYSHLHPNHSLIGQWAVTVFIVLSGYCLMVPTEAAGGLRGGMRAFFVRRSRRILPAYYAALLLAVLLGYRDTTASALAHLLLIQNWSRAWIYGYDGPMWSLATEWQIYFIFALVLVPVWKRYGRATTIFVALALSGLPYCFDWPVIACPDFLFCFALGMAATWMKSARWQMPITGTLWALLTAVSQFFPVWSKNHVPMFDIIIAASAMLLLASMTQGGRVASLLSTKPLVAIGAFSYSLYLIHEPINLRLVGVLPWYLIVVIVLVSAYIFSLAFEKPFLTSRAVSKKASLSLEKEGSASVT